MTISQSNKIKRINRIITINKQQRAIIVSKWPNTIIDKRANALQLYDTWTNNKQGCEYNDQSKKDSFCRLKETAYKFKQTINYIN